MASFRRHLARTLVAGVVALLPVGGLVLAHLNRPPQRADEVTIEGVRYVVDAVDGLAITHLSIYLPSNGNSDRTA